MHGKWAADLGTRRVDRKYKDLSIVSELSGIALKEHTRMMINNTVVCEL